MSSRPSISDILKVMDSFRRQKKASEKIIEIRRDPNIDEATMISIDTDLGETAAVSGKIAIALLRLKDTVIWQSMLRGGTATDQEWEIVRKDYEALCSSVNEFHSIINTILGRFGLSADDFAADEA
ncbi:hypothetical protein Hte_007105 [Hypoxylon texense]